jgi:hypothetical protein
MEQPTPIRQPQPAERPIERAVGLPQRPQPSPSQPVRQRPTEQPEKPKDEPKARLILDDQSRITITFPLVDAWRAWRRDCAIRAAELQGRCDAAYGGGLKQGGMPVYLIEQLLKQRAKRR